MPRKKSPIPEVPEIDKDNILVDGGYYKGNENLLNKNAKIIFTEEMFEENRTCAKSILHFAERHFHIVNLDEGKIKIKLRKYQKRILKSLKDERRLLVCASRQMGKSTIVSMYALWLVCFHEYKKVAILANKADTAIEIFSRIKMAFEELPVYLKPAVKSNRKNGFDLSNGSSIIVSSTSASAVRGQSINCLIIDEMAHIQNDLMEELWKSVIPTITSSKKSQIVGISTPNGADKENKFYQLYLEAQKPDSGWKLEKVHWSENDDRNEEWKKSEIASLGSLHTFQQEHENMFHALGKSVISAEHLEELKKLCKEPILATDEGSYKIYRQPKPTSHYIIGVDVGEGIGRTNTVAQVLDVSDLTNIEQVAIFASNTITPYHFGTRLIGIANDWGRPPILIENNNYGQQVLDVVARTHNYESVVTYKFEGMSQHYNNENRLGIYNHTNTRYRSMTNFRYWVDSLKAVKIFDLDTLIEIAEFVQLPNYTFSKKNESDRDDRVWSLVWALFILEPTLAQKYFNVKQTDDQGRPLFMTPFIDNSDLIKKSPIIFGTVNTTKKEISYNAPLAYLPEGKIKEDPAIISEGLGFQSELLKWEPNITKHRYEYEYKSHSPEIIWRSNDKKEQELKNEDGYNPLVFF
jgi:hypothetical protein